LGKITETPPLFVFAEVAKNLWFGMICENAFMYLSEGMRVSCKQTMELESRRKPRSLTILAKRFLMPPGQVELRELIFCETIEGIA
jgi:hypothetical protein